MITLFILNISAIFTNDIRTWPQAAGPNNNWQVEGDAPTTWSLVRDENILWRTPMPEAGMSAVIVWEDKAFTVIHKPVKSIDELKKAQDVIGYCLDVNDGSVLWTVEIPGQATIPLGSGFSDGTSQPPVTDGKHVWFFNRLGSIGCFTMNGEQVWMRQVPVRYRHSNRQHKPMIYKDWIIHVEVADKNFNTRSSKNTDKNYPDEIVNDKRFWTYIHALDKKTGKVVWHEQVGTSIHNTPALTQFGNGKWGIAHARGGRGGGYIPPEQPCGMSLTMLDGKNFGNTLWSTKVPSFTTSYNLQAHSNGILAFNRGNHLVFDLNTGEIINKTSYERSKSLWVYDSVSESWQHKKEGIVKNSKSKGSKITNQSNILVGDWHYFRAHGNFMLGRVHVQTGNTEYLQLPAQIYANSNSRKKDIWIWEPKKGHNNQPVNANNIDISHKNGINDTGWGHVSSGSPIRVGKYLYIPTITGTVYVIDVSLDILSPESLISINDMGASEKAWSLASMSFSKGKLFLHTALEVFCVTNIHE